MKRAIIDVGSNSVRLLLDGEKYIENTQLSEGLAVGGLLQEQPILRTIDAIVKFHSFAKNNGAECVSVFATEAVRSANNGVEFVARLKEYGINLEVISPEQESLVAFLGAYTQGTRAILDIGGASSELVVGDESGIKYSCSLPVGCVRLKDYSTDLDKVKAYAKKMAELYVDVPVFDGLTAIGGTATTLCAVIKELEPYDRNKVHGSTINREQLEKAVTKILSTPLEKRTLIKGLHPKRITVAPMGGIWLLAIMDYLNLSEITVSESDNLEGFLQVSDLQRSWSQRAAVQLVG